MRNLFISLLIMVTASACAAGTRQNNTESSASTERENETIEMPDIPRFLTNPTERADYLIIHFWDKLNVNNPEKSHDTVLLEQSLANFLSILPYASSDSIISRGFTNMFDKTVSDEYVYGFLTKNTENYLNDSRSPMFSEAYYLLFLETLKESKHTTPTEKIRLEDKIEMTSKNRRGSKAADFSFVQPDGKESTLYQTLSPGQDLMLIFFDPSCETCEEVMKDLMEDSDINEKINQGKLQILAVYSGENENLWRKKALSLPASWTVGINKSEIEDEELYILPSMPTIYMLDGNGIVIDKDIQY